MRARTEQKPLSGYMLFSKGAREGIIKSNPGIAFGEVRPPLRPPPPAHAPSAPCVARPHTAAPSLCVRQVGKKLGAAWKSLSDAEKAKYK